MLDFNSHNALKRHSPQCADVDKSIDGQLDYVREQFKWYDTRYAWSTVWSFGNMYYIFANIVPLEKFGHSGALFWEYLVSVMLGLLFFGMSVTGTAYGMIPFQLWSRKVRTQMGCTSFMWSKNVSEFPTASAFLESLATLDSEGVRKARASELWRLSMLLEQRESGLVWARTGAVCLSLAAFVFTIAVFSVTGVIKFPMPLPH